MTSEIPTDADRLGAAAHALARLSRHLEHALQEADLTLPQYRLLLFLQKSPDAASRLAASLHVRPPSLTSLVDGMVTRGLVQRSHDEHDRRRVSIDLTTEGRSHLAKADAVAIRRLDFLESLDPSGTPLAEGLSGWREALEAARHQRVGK